MTTLEVARLYLQAGLSMVPIRRDGSKAPSLRRWKWLEEELPTSDHLDEWYGGVPLGIAVICGRVSGHLELIDFDRDSERIFPAWRTLVEAERPNLFERLSVVRTPRPGFHVRYRCTEAVIPGNTRLAVDPSSPGNDRCLVETRGEGGYALAPGTPPECHELRRTYDHVHGPMLTALSDITAAERLTLLRCARAFDLTAAADTSGPPVAARVGDDYDLRGPDWEAILGPHGWEVARQQDGVRFWRRPGKDGRGWSATTGHCHGKNGEDLLRVFSSNGHPFAEGKSYGKFRAAVLLDFGGDFGRAAQALARQGYGPPDASRRGSPGARPAPPGQAAESSARLQVQRMSLLRMRPVRWLVPDFIPSGSLTVIAGDGGYGKSSLTVHLAACLTTGRPCFGLDYVAPPGGRVLLAGCEDSDEATVLPRLASAEADLERVESIRDVADDEGGRPWVLSEFGVGLLAQTIEERGDVLAICIDPVSAFVPDDHDDHKDAHVRRMLRRLADLAERTEVAIVLVKHLNKSDSNNGGNLVSGSRGYVNAARAAFLLGADPMDDEDTGRRVLVFCKRNLTTRKAGLAFRAVALTEEEQRRVLDLPQAQDLGPEDRLRLAAQLFRLGDWAESEATSNDLARSRRGKADGEDRTGRAERAAVWLREHLADGERKANDILAAGQEAGHSRSALYEASDRGLVVLVRVRRGFGTDGAWYWRLADPPSPFPAGPAPAQSLPD